jgi:hypothetical protein
MSVLSSVQSALDVLFDVILLPLSPAPPLAGLVWLSALCGILLALMFRAVSDQDLIGDLRRRMTALAIGMLLHLSQPRSVISIAGRLLAANLRYLGAIVLPLAVAALPFMLFMGQAGARYSSRPAVELSTVVLIAGGDGIDSAVAVSGGLELEGPVLRLHEPERLAFRVSGGSGTMVSGGLEIDAGGGGGRVLAEGFTTRPGALLLLDPSTRILVPGSHGAPVSGTFSTLVVMYHVLGRWWTWTAVFLVVSSLAALGAGIVMKIRI